MNHNQVSRFLAILAAVCLGVFCDSAFSQSAERSSQPTLEKALSQKDTFRYSDVPLSDFISVLREKYSMNVVLDQRTLKEKDIDPDTKLSINLENVSVRSALELAIRPIGLSWTIYCEAVVVTTPAAIQGMQFTKVYDVTGLMPASSDQEKSSGDLESLLDLFPSILSPESWEGAGGRGTIQLVTAGAAKMLIVSQDYRVQWQVQNLLSEMQASVKLHTAVKDTKSEGPAMGTKGKGTAPTNRGETPGPGTRGESPAPGPRGDRPAPGPRDSVPSLE
jgi:hypothetical protein